MGDSNTRHRLLHYSTTKWEAGGGGPIFAAIALIPRKITTEPGAYEVEATEMIRPGKTPTWTTSKTVVSGSDMDKALDYTESVVDEKIEKLGFKKEQASDVK